MSIDLNKTFCIFPFVQTVIRTGGSLGPCCEIRTDQNIKEISIENFWHGSFVKKLRSNMIAGLPSSQCSACYNKESKFGKSMRTNALIDYKFYNHNDYLLLLDHFKFCNTSFPKRIELHLGNLCNLKCLTCNPRDSSAFLAEDQILKISNHNQQDYQLDDQTINKILTSALEHDVDLLDLRGGETMLMPVIKDLLLKWPQDHADKLTVRIQTNCTIMNSDWENIFKKFKQFDIMMSIDGYGIDNEYIRFPSKWKDIERNVDFMTQIPNAKTYVNCTISNLNFLLLPRLIDWCRARNIFFHWNNVENLPEFHYTNLPVELFVRAQQGLNKYPELQSLLSQRADTTHWDKFCQIINIRDNYRKNRIFDILPQLNIYWKEL
jgi:sulfatase maturation enzyme AslB (radical SAM superfamily)